MPHADPAISAVTCAVTADTTTTAARVPDVVRGGVSGLRDTPLVVGRLLFSIVPDPRRLRLLCSNLAGAVEVRSHHDSPGPGGGLVLVHSAAPLYAGHDPISCEVTGSCHPWLDRHSYAARFAALLAADDLDAVIAAMTRLHDRVLA